MTALVTSLESEMLTALDTVLDPELDQPITELGFVRSILIDDLGVTVHLRLPTSFCSPNFAYLMASDAVDALGLVSGVGQVRVMLDDHHDSDKINAGLAAGVGYRGTFGDEAEDSLDELRLTFQRKAHLAAMERSCMQMLRRGTWSLDELCLMELRDLPLGANTRALLRRRASIGLGIEPSCRVMVDNDGVALRKDEAPMRLRFATATRISIEGNSHFCRGMLATRYDDAGSDNGPVITNLRSAV
ncbi:iron-sulfur cluster assembly protein [Leekyejoonella antrihumi]|uniref:Iron-sulfur cluster assembly protein n=1 Tax=Leekyejoonella antrihumi TaxID=1660198 RepID=A0A563DZI8_9MICO|nr:iron-sulfur cluster assembly protein [Leekyejoonella antrihumi]TWP35605.1 iron-sulfur cluster assembly protein [Leekyejoonella antrihumi]